MRIIETEAYTFDELSDDAKENAKIELASEYFWENDCQKDYEYQQTDEFMIEHCEANEYEFTKEGKLI